MKKIISILISAILALSVLGVSASARLLGDVNGDKKTNSSDALTILMYSVGLNTTLDSKLGDVNNDGKVNSSDALIVLTISVGSYKGPTTVDNKTDIVDPIFKSGKFTLTTTVTVDGEEIPTTLMVNGNNMCLSMKVQGINTRMLVLNGKTYMVIPDLLVYCELPDETAAEIDFSSIDFGSNLTFKGSRYVTEGSKTYTVDSYAKADGTISDYYFLNGKWVRVVDEPGTKNEETQEITEFKSGVTASYFSLTGLIKVSYQSA